MRAIKADQFADKIGKWTGQNTYLITELQALPDVQNPDYVRGAGKAFHYAFWNRPRANLLHHQRNDAERSVHASPRIPVEVERDE